MAFLTIVYIQVVIKVPLLLLWSELAIISQSTEYVDLKGKFKNKLLKVSLLKREVWEFRVKEWIRSSGYDCILVFFFSGNY